MVVKRDSYPEFAAPPREPKTETGYGYLVARAALLLGFAAMLGLEGWLIWQAWQTFAVR